jgi:hypothetical protein
VSRKNYDRLSHPNPLARCEVKNASGFSYLTGSVIGGKDV